MLVIIVIVVIIFSSLIRSCIRPKNYPNGPVFLPLIGSAWSLPPKGAEYKIEKWRKKYGNLIGHKLGEEYLVIVSGPEEIIEGLKHPNFQGRFISKFFTQRSFFRPLGFFFADNETWSEVRRFTLRYFGQVFNAPLEVLLDEELSEHFSSIRSGEITNIDGPFMKSPLNIILKLLVGVSGKDYPNEVEDIRFKTEQAFQIGRVSGIEVVYPSMRRMFHNHILEASFGTIQNFFKMRLEEHKRSFDSLNIKDYTDAFLLQREKELEANGSVENYTDAEYLSCCLDVVQAGTESTGKTIEFLLLYVSLNSRVQEKLHEEIDLVLGKNRSPTVSNRSDLPYVEATIYETMRINPIAPLGVLHRVTENTNFRGFTIEKDTLLLFALMHYMNDSELWDRPKEFMPERFLNKDRKNKKIPNFGLGKRACIGEVLVKNFIFLYVANFFQKYSIKLPSGYPNPSTEPILGITNGPKPFKLIITKRV